MRSQVFTITLLAFVAGAPMLAGEYSHDKSNGSGHGRVWCPRCGEACYPTMNKGTETKHWWETESKPICIPKVRFPWESSGKGKGLGRDGCVTPKCGRTKYVKVLIKHECEHSVGKYRWDPSSSENGAKSDGNYLVAPHLAAADLAVPSPTSVEARRPPPPDYLRIVDRDRPGDEVRSSPTTSNGNASSFFSSFFR